MQSIKVNYGYALCDRLDLIAICRANRVHYCRYLLMPRGLTSSRRSHASDQCLEAQGQNEY